MQGLSATNTHQLYDCTNIIPDQQPQPNDSNVHIVCSDDSTCSKKKKNDSLELFVLESYQNICINQFYNIYVDAVNSAGKNNPVLVKRAFNEYITSIEDNYLRKADRDFCDTREQTTCNLNNQLTVAKHKDHDMDHMTTLGNEFYALFKILDMVLKNESTKKRDIVVLTPCRVFLLHSVIKRKYGVDLDFRYA